MAGPSTLFQTGNHASRPAASAGCVLYWCTTHNIVYVSSGSAWSTFQDLSAVSGGMTDPMTTRGDIIVRNSSNATARLGIGSNGKVLSSDGTDISWQTPSASGTPAFVGVRGIRTTAQTISTATLTAIAFNGTDTFDTDAFHDPASNSSRFTVPSGKAGYYGVSANLQWAASTAGARLIAIRKTLSGGGTSLVAECEYNPNFTAVDGVGSSLSGIVQMAVGDYLELVVYQTSGGNLDTRAAAEGCNFQMALLGT